MSSSQKIIGNLGLFELALLGVGGGAMAFFLFNAKLEKAAAAGALTVLLGSLVELFATGVAYGQQQ